MKNSLSKEVTKLLYSILDYELRANEDNQSLSTRVVHHHIENLVNKVKKKEFIYDLCACDELTINRIACSKLSTNKELCNYFVLILTDEEEKKKHFES